MKLLFWMAVLYVIAYFIQAVAKCFSRKKWTNHDLGLLVGLSLCLTFISYFVIPDETTDLWRYHAVANWYKLGKTSFYSATVKSISASSSTLYLHVLFLYIVSKLNNNSLLQVIWCSLTYGFFTATIQKFATRFKLETNRIYPTVFMFFGLVSYFTCVSNLRYPCLCVLFFFAVYLKLFEGKNYPLVIVSIVGIGMHLSIFMMLLIWIVYLVSKKTSLYRCIVFWSLLVNLIIAVLERLPIDRLRYVGEKLYYYFNVYEENLSMRLRLIFISLQIVILVLMYLTKKHRWNYLDEGYKSYYKFLECLLLFAIGSIANDTMLKRTMILLGPCLIPALGMIMPVFKYKNHITILWLIYGFGLIALYMVSLFTFFSFAV